MACSRFPGVLGRNETWSAARTPGTLGLFDQGDPNLCTLLGDSPGVLGVADHGDPTLPSLLQGDTPVGAQLVRLPDGSSLSMPVQAVAIASSRAPWMTFAEAQAREFKGAKEAQIQQTRNFHKEVGTGQDSLVGTAHAWCAAFKRRSTRHILISKFAQRCSVISCAEARLLFSIAWLRVASHWVR